MANVTEKRLREIVVEELIAVKEGVDHGGIRDVVNSASKLLKAVEAFKEKASPTVQQAVSKNLVALEKALENMVSNPGSYTELPAKPRRVIKMKPVSSDESD